MAKIALRFAPSLFCHYCLFWLIQASSALRAYSSSLRQQEGTKLSRKDIIMYRNMNLPPIEEVLNQLSDAAIEMAQMAILNGQITPEEVPEYTRQWIKF